MQDASYALQKAYAGLLAGLTYNSQLVPIYTLMAANSAVAPYVILGSWTEQKDNTKDSFGQKGELTIQVVTRYPGDQVGRKAAVEIANLITALIKPTPTSEVLEVEGFKNWNTTISSVGEITQNTTTDTVFRKIITVSHYLRQV